MAHAVRHLLGAIEVSEIKISVIGIRDPLAVTRRRGTRDR
jgi:hypothetical protein